MLSENHLAVICDWSSTIRDDAILLDICRNVCLSTISVYVLIAVTFNYNISMFPLFTLYINHYTENWTEKAVLQQLRG